MKKRAVKVMLAISLLIIGILLIGYGFTTELGHPISTTCLLLGLGLVFLGFVYFIKIASSNE